MIFPLVIDCSESGALGLIHSEHVTENGVGVFAEARWRTTRRIGHAVDMNAGANLRHSAAATGNLVKHTPVQQHFIRDDLINAVDRTRRNSRGTEQRQSMIARPFTQDFFDSRDDALSLLPAICVGTQT